MCEIIKVTVIRTLMKDVDLRGGSNSSGGLVKTVEILKKRVVFLGQTLTKVEPSKVK